MYMYRENKTYEFGDKASKMAVISICHFPYVNSENSQKQQEFTYHCHVTLGTFTWRSLWCTFDAHPTWVELDTHRSCSHGTASKQIRSQLWQAWVLQIMCLPTKSSLHWKNLHLLSRTMLESCSDVCPTSTCCSESSHKVVQWNHHDC